MFVAGDPGDGAVGKRADDGSKPQRHVPEAVELGQARARREDRDHGSACGLGRAHGEAREIGGDPELPALGREGGDGDHRDPDAERARERELVADAVLHVAEGESADGGRDVHEEDHEERVLGLEPHDGGGIDGRERDDDGDAALIEEPADGKPGKVAEVAERAERAAQLRKALRGGAPDGLAVRSVKTRHAPLLEEEEDRKRGGREDESRHGHRARHGLVHPVAELLAAEHHAQTEAERKDAAAVAEAPAPARNLAHGVLTGELGQEGRVEGLAHVVGDVAHDDHEGGPDDRARSREHEAERAAHGHEGRDGEPALLRGGRVGHRADDGHQQHAHRIAHRDDDGPEERRRGGVARHHAHEVGVEDGREHHGRVARIGKVECGPGPDLAHRDAVLESGPGEKRHVVLLLIARFVRA